MSGIDVFRRFRYKIRIQRRRFVTKTIFDVENGRPFTVFMAIFRNGVEFSGGEIIGIRQKSYFGQQKLVRARGPKALKRA